VVVMGMIIGRSLTRLNPSDIAGVRRREMVRRSDDNSRRKVQNVRADSSGCFFVTRYCRVKASST
jgi:hypothetical protein